MWRVSGLTAADQVIDQWLFAHEKVFLQNLLPVVAIEYKFVLEEIYVGSLIPRRTLEPFRPHKEFATDFGLPR